ncbi:MAG: NADH-quinone oxidoreductase subunit C [Deltaproteobacteria bacterium]|nr:NADH-quinone oxidoreductase subunit C [Deltaproteobacteria bacterium]
MNAAEIFKKLAGEFGDSAVFDFHEAGKDKDPWFQVDAFSIEPIAVKMKTDPELHFDYLECVTGIDFPDDKKIHVVYHLYSYAKKHRVVVKVLLDRDDPVVPTLTHVWPTANWQERECFDLLGVLFDGHPDLRRILLPDDWEGHPLRKDYEAASEYHGIPTIRPNPVELFSIKLPEKKAQA